jgi:hypothetical protein
LICAVSSCDNIFSGSKWPSDYTYRCVVMSFGSLIKCVQEGYSITSPRETQAFGFVIERVPCRRNESFVLWMVNTRILLLEPTLHSTRNSKINQVESRAHSYASM